MRAYEYFKSCDFSTQPPILFAGNYEDTEGGQETPTPRPDETDAFGYLNRLLNTFMYKSGNYKTNSWIQSTNIMNMEKLKLSFKFSDINFDDFENWLKSVLDKEQEDHNNVVNDELEGITDADIQKIVAKALSYPDGSVPYSMYGKRDMIESGDCSSYVSICYNEVGLSIGGWTGAIYSTAKGLGKVIIEGGRDVIPQIIQNTRPGDLVMLSRNSTHTSQEGSHIGVMVSNTLFRHQGTSRNRMGPWSETLSEYVNTVTHTYWALVRYIG